MQKKFILNLLLILLLNFIVKPFYILGIDAEVLKQTGEEYGIYFSLLGLTFILNIFLDLGIVNYNTRNIAQHNQLLDKYFPSIFSIRILLSILYFILIYAIAYILNYPVEYYYLLGVLSFNQVLIAFILYLRSNLSGLLLFKQDSFISVLDRGVLIIVLSYLLWGRTSNTPFKIEWFVYSQTLAYFITFLVAIFFVLKNTGNISFRFKKNFSIAIIKQSMPYALLILLMMIYYRSDAIMLERLCVDGKKETSIYAQGYRFFEAFNMIGYLFAGLLLPMFSNMLKNKQDISNLLQMSFKLLFLISLIISSSIYLNKTEIIEWRYGVFGQELHQSASAFGVLMLCFVAVSTTYIYGTLLTANGNLKMLNLLALVGVVINVILNLFLIPKYGVFGAAIASFITQLATALGQIVLSKKIVTYSFSRSSIVSLSAFTVFIVILYYIFSIGMVEVVWYVKLLIFIILGFILAIVTKMFNYKEIMQIIKENKVNK